MRSTWTSPRFQDLRDEMNIRPLRYRKAKAIAMFRFEEWKERHYEAKWKAMIDQKREPNAYASHPWMKRMGLSTWEAASNET